MPDEVDTLKQGKKLEGTGISISSDLSKKYRNELKILSKHLKGAKEKYPNAKNSGTQADNNKYRKRFI